MLATKSHRHLLQENTELQARLAEAEETLRAIRSGEVDALVVSTSEGNQIFTLQNADQPYRLLVEQMQQGAVTISSDGTILYCNRHFADTLGYASDILVSRQIEQYIVQQEGELFRAFLQAASSDGSANQEFNFQNQIKQIVPMFVTANLLRLDQTQVICLIIADMRGRKKAEQQAIELAAEKQRTKLLADFVRDTSHDLKTPITVILNGLYLIQRLQDEERRSKKIQDVVRYVWYLNRILEQFQQMAMLDSMTELSLQTVDVNRLITDMLHTVSKQADEKQITISSALEDGIVSIHCDPDMLHRALVELLENAIQFTPQGRQIQVRVGVGNHNQLMLEVVDNGMGIPQDKLPHIFERFYKGDEARRVTGGGGLGLSIVKRIIELHHGSIEVESAVGEKTIFRMMLPAVVSEAKTISK
jgi:PAS domain S-box-containing protein